MSGPIVVTSTSTPTGVSLPLYRRVLMRRLGPSAVYTTTGLSTTVDARRHVLCDRLIDGAARSTAFDGRHLYVASGNEAGHQTCVLPGGYIGALGLLQVQHRFSSALASGSEIELSGSLPAKQYGDWPCLNDCINEALGSFVVHLDLAYTYVNQQIRYGLSDLARNFRREDILDVYPPLPDGYTAEQVRPRPIPRGGWSVEYDGEGPYLSLPWGFTDGDTFFVRVRRLASNWINSGGAWGTSDTGLSDDTDEALYDVDTIVNTALPFACDRLESYHRQAGDDRAADSWARKRERVGPASALTRFFRGVRTDGSLRIGAR